MIRYKKKKKTNPCGFLKVTLFYETDPRSRRQNMIKLDYLVTDTYKRWTSDRRFKLF